MIQERLGFDSGDRLVVVQVDDIGMSHPANVGALRVLEDTPNCGSVMVPCPAFDEIAEIARARPELDLAVHITLNSEFPDHRWGPVLDDVPSLTRPDGTLWQRSRETVRHANPGEVAREMRAQVQRVNEVHDDHEVRGRGEQGQRDPRESGESSGPVDLGGLIKMRRNALQSGEVDDHVESHVLPDTQEDDRQHCRVGRPKEFLSRKPEEFQNIVEESELWLVKPKPDQRNGHEGTHHRQI